MMSFFAYTKERIADKGMTDLLILSSLQYLLQQHSLSGYKIHQ